MAYSCSSTEAILYLGPVHLQPFGMISPINVGLLVFVQLDGVCVYCKGCLDLCVVRGCEWH